MDLLTIATLNYDRSIENAAELKGATYDTGIETWLARGEFEWREADLRLLKLHGSIDWVVKRPEFVSGELPAQQIVKVLDPAEKQRYDQSAVVFGEAEKLRSEGPFLELLLAWAAALKRAANLLVVGYSFLLVVGYSFRDQHVNELSLVGSTAHRGSGLRGRNPPSEAGSGLFSPAGAAGLEPATPGFGDRCSAS